MTKPNVKGATLGAQRAKLLAKESDEAMTVKGPVGRPACCPRVRVQTVFDADTNPSRTQQHMAAACDINNIMSRYEKTGVIEHGNRARPEYGFVPAVDFREAVEIIKNGETRFAELPAALRRRFNDSPVEFLDFVSDPANLDEMRSLGLAKPESGTPVEGTPPNEPPAASEEV